MVDEIRKVLAEIERQLSEADNTNDKQCNDMTLTQLKVANEWQKRKIKKPPDPIIMIDVGALMANRSR